MKIEQLFEVRSTSDINSLGVNIDQFSQRQLLDHHNGYNIYLRHHTQDSNTWLLDIDEQAFVYGVIGDQFKGQIKHKIFSSQRGWTTPESRNKGLITNIMLYLFNKRDFALMCDDIISPSGKAMWLKLCDTLRITHFYQVDTKTNQLAKISKDQMIQQFNNTEDDWQYIVEDNFDYTQLIGDRLPASILKGPLAFEKYIFEGYP